jgi:hypothetical protein
MDAPRPLGVDRPTFLIAQPGLASDRYGATSP